MVLKRGEGNGDRKRVVVVHCKAGKGRSGTMACSFLISERGWTPGDALDRFTQRRMRPNFGDGVSIPSQLRWISYVDRWARGGKVYVDRQVEIIEVHVWGLRHGVKVAVEGFAEEGKRIEVVHTFTRDERIVVEGNAPGGGGVRDLVSDMAKYGLAERDEDAEIVEDADYEGVVERKQEGSKDGNSPSRNGSVQRKGSRTSNLMRKISTRRNKSSQSLNKIGNKEKSKTIAMPSSQATPTASGTSTPDAGDESAQSRSTSNLPGSFLFADPGEPGGQAVIFKPANPIIIPNGDVNITIERRNRAPASLGLTMVTAVAHVWFNTFFEGNGPEQNGKADDSGVFEIEWDKLDGIKGSSQKGTRACDRLSVVWRVPGTSGDGTAGGEEERDADGVVATAAGVTIREPGENSPVPQMEAADWKGAGKDPSAERHLGLRVECPDSEGVSKASSVKSEEGEGAAEEDSLQGVKISGPLGEDILDASPTPEKVGEPGLAVAPASKKEEKTADATAQKGFIVE